jgi:hypothetical protein
MACVAGIALALLAAGVLTFRLQAHAVAAKAV